MKPFNIESMDNKNNNVKNYIEQGKELKSGQIASSHLIKTLEIYGFIPVKTGRIIYNEIIDILTGSGQDQEDQTVWQLHLQNTRRCDSLPV